MGTQAIAALIQECSKGRTEGLHTDAERELLTLIRRVETLEAALRPFANFAEKFDQQPLRGTSDEFYTIHSGTKWEAALRVSDCRKARDVLKEGK